MASTYTTSKAITNSSDSSKALANARKALGVGNDVPLTYSVGPDGKRTYSAQYTGGQNKPVSQAAYQKQYPTPTYTPRPTSTSYNPNWQQQALDQGKDINSPEFDPMRAAEASQPSAEQTIASLADELAKAMEVYTKRGEEFDANNPFTFDEVQARASAEEAFNPYYSAELNDFVKGIDLKRKSTEGERDLLSELNRVQAGAEKRNLDEAIRQSEEGYAGAGLFFSGARERGTGMQGIAGAEKTGVRESQYQFGQEQAGRNLQGLNTAEATGRRQIGAEKTTNIESRLANLKAEESARHETERAQYIGYPGTSMTGGFNQLLQSAFQY